MNRVKWCRHHPCSVVGRLWYVCRSLGLRWRWVAAGELTAVALESSGVVGIGAVAAGPVAGVWWGDVCHDPPSRGFGVWCIASGTGLVMVLVHVSALGYTCGGSADPLCRRVDVGCVVWAVVCPASMLPERQWCQCCPANLGKMPRWWLSYLARGGEPPILAAW